mmetsp:Transcript_36740/g.103687  ORF Transcript_36740/g.103687 Transcript_36740/m.103687 type:complete len:431 (+) Transcript_36740:169-1461(+)
MEKMAKQSRAAMALRPFDPVLAEVKARSVALGADPKAKEMIHFLGSRSHENRLRGVSGPAGTVPRSVPPLHDMTARLRWREEMDRGIRRLMQDADLAMDERIQEDSQHQLRCNHLDKTYEWFEHHGNKEVTKERESPAFLRFDKSAAPMAGSPRWRPRSPGNDPEAAAPTRPSVFVTAAAQTVSATPRAGAAGALNAGSLAPEGVRHLVLAGIHTGERGVERGIHTATDELDIYRKENDKFGEALMSLTLAELYLLRSNYEQALEHAKVAKVSFGSIGEKTFEAKSHLTLANAHALRGELAEALASAKKTYEIRAMLGDRKGEAEAMEMTTSLEDVIKEVHNKDDMQRRKIVAEKFTVGKRLESQLAKEAGAEKGRHQHSSVLAVGQTPKQLMAHSTPRATPRTGERPGATPRTGERRKASRMRASPRLS